MISTRAINNLSHRCDFGGGSNDGWEISGKSVSDSGDVMGDRKEFAGINS
jgi:hypothetical protein